VSGRARVVIRRGALGAALLCLSAAGAVIAQSVPSTSGPSITPDPSTVEVGDQIGFTVAGFDGPDFVVSVCGNEARRGSSDCDMLGSKALPIDRDNDSITVNQMRVGKPPAPCPCVLRAASSANDEVAVAPIELLGHPVAPVVDGGAVRDPLVLVVEARPAPQGIADSVRAALGGPARYEVTVTIRNRSVIPASSVTLAASGGRSDDDFQVTLAPEDPGIIPAGQTWQQTFEAVVPYPSFGTFHWRATASGAGVPVTASTITNSKPTLLIALAMFLVIDLFLLLIRFTIRRRVAREDESSTGEAQPEVDADRVLIDA
jgi:hypothetical protein